jgi:hypothetical protein
MTAPLDANGKPLKVGDAVFITAKIVAMTNLRKVPYLIVQAADDGYDVVLNIKADQVEKRK